LKLEKTETLNQDQKMRFTIFSILFCALIAFGTSCRKNFEFAPSAGNLEFSKDTVFLDTIFSNIGSSTYSLTVYNTTRDDIEIPSIRLQQGSQSGYRLNVDGVAGKEFQNIPILAQDSMFIFIETTFDIANIGQKEFLYTDKLLFDVDEDRQEVELVALVKDAVFLFPEKNAQGIKETISLGTDINGEEIIVDGFMLENERLQFTNQKPYVIYGYAAVPEGKTLSVEAGSRVHFHSDSGIYVRGGGKLQVNGSLSEDPALLENEVIFEGDRLEPEFDGIPGQWGAVLIAPGSIENTIYYLTIKNASIGLLVQGNAILDAPTLTLRNSQIHNSLNVNLWAKSAKVIGENLILGAAGNQSLYCNNGGHHTFRHCTFANYWINGFRLGPAVQIDNSTGTQPENLNNVTFINCIIEGSQARELQLLENESNTFDFSFTNCLIRFEKNGQFENNPLYNFENEALYQNNIFNESAGFFDAFTGDYRIEESSAANGKAEPDTALQIPLDLFGINRTNAPEIGALEITPQN